MSIEDGLLREVYLNQDRDIGAIGRVFEAAIENCYRDIIMPGDEVLDIGAHCGRHTWPMAECVGPSGKVYAFEALNRLYVGMLIEARLRDLSQVALFNAACAETRKLVQFSEFKENEAFSGIVARTDLDELLYEKLHSIELAACALDTVLPASSRLTFVKADIEGGEFHAMVGAKQLLSNSRPIIAFEHGRQKTAELYQYHAADFFDFFTMLGYRLYDVSGVPFLMEEWNEPRLCWNYYAVPEENSEASARFPQYLRNAMAQLADPA